jgi:hypothetical protein
VRHTERGARPSGEAATHVRGAQTCHHGPSSLVSVPKATVLTQQTAPQPTTAHRACATHAAMPQDGQEVRIATERVSGPRRRRRLLERTATALDDFLGARSTWR